MIIDRIDTNLFALRIQAGGVEPEGRPLVTSLLNVWRCQAGFLIEHTGGVLDFGGYYLFARAQNVRSVESTDTVLRNKEIVVFNTPGQVTLVTSPIASDLIQNILDSQ